MVKCNVCGKPLNKFVKKCKSCFNVICDSCYWKERLQCIECVVEEYNFNYKDKLEAYHKSMSKGIISIGEID